MIVKTSWTSRVFDFNFPVGHFPAIYVRLLGTPARIDDLVKNCFESHFEFKPDGRWSVKEHIGHLVDLEELHEGRLLDYKNKATLLRAADMTNKKTNEANHNSYPVARLMSDFWKSRNHFLKRLKSFNESELIQSSVHPRLNVKMRLVDMASFVADHDDHHLICMIEALVKAKK